MRSLTILTVSAARFPRLWGKQSDLFALSFTRFLILTLLAIGLSACGSVYSSKDLNSVTAENSQGLPYFLPTTLLQIAMDSDKQMDGAKNIGVLEVTNLVGPDSRHAYLLKHNKSVFSDDEVFLTTNPLGLLTTVNTVVEDRTGDVITAVARAASGIYAVALPPSQKVRTKSVPLRQRCRTPGDTWTIIIDPLDKSTWPAWFDEKCLKITPIGDSPPPIDGHSASAGRNDLSDQCGKGICYRVPYPYRAEFTVTPGMFEQTNFLFMGQSPVLAYDVRRSPLVKNVVNLRIYDGVLTEVDTNHPSVALAVARFPISLTQAILEAPATLLSLRVDYDSAKEAELDSRQRLLERQEEYADFLQQSEER